MEIKIRNGWIFSQRQDILMFVIPFLAGWLLVLIDRLLDLRSVYLFGKDSLVILFALLAFLDAGHVFSTVFKSYFDENIRARKKFLLYGIPVLLYAFMILLYRFFGMRSVLIFFGYFNIYHIIRQQYGWVSISARKAGENDRLDHRIDQITIYSFMIIPVIWIHFSLPGTEKQFTLPRSRIVADTCVIVWLAVFVLYWCRQLVKTFSGVPINLSKTLQMMISCLAWGAVIFFRSPVLLVVTVFLHSVPYLGIVYKTKERSGAGNDKVNALFAYRYSILIFLVVVLTIGIFYTKTDNFVKGLGLRTLFGIPREYFLCALLLFPLMHFVIDGVIWRRKHYPVQRSA